MVNKYFSMFSGIGGFEKAIQKVIPNAICVGYSEIDKYAIQIYEKQFRGHKNYGNATDIKPEQLPDFDLLVGGFPCQAFSIAGNRRGFEDTRGTLFFEIARVIKGKQPKMFLLENVKGLLNHDKGNTFTKILQTIDELGYDAEWQVLNSKHFGVPQNRERVFIVGHLRGTSGRKVFPINGTTGKDIITDWKETQCNSTINPSGIMPTLSSCTHGYANPSILQLNQPTHSNDRVYDKEGLSPCLNTAQGGNRQPFIAMTEKRTDEAKLIKKEIKDRDYSPRRGKYLAPREDSIGNCVTSGHSKEHLLSDSKRIRRLTPTECERLQGFPDGWTEGLSDTQRYKTLGNAVTVNVIEAIMKRLLDCLNKD